MGWGAGSGSGAVKGSGTDVIATHEIVLRTFNGNITTLASVPMNVLPGR